MKEAGGGLTLHLRPVITRRPLFHQIDRYLILGFSFFHLILSFPQEKRPGWPAAGGLLSRSSLSSKGLLNIGLETWVLLKRRH